MIKTLIFFLILLNNWKMDLPSVLVGTTCIVVLIINAIIYDLLHNSRLLKYIRNTGGYKNKFRKPENKWKLIEYETEYMDDVKYFWNIWEDSPHASCSGSVNQLQDRIINIVSNEFNYRVDDHNNRAVPSTEDELSDVSGIFLLIII